jgi:acetolactate synthase-1/2/3 large subunit
VPSSPAGRLAATLRDHGVGRLFGVPGGGPNLDMIGAAAGVGIPFVLAHGETAACVMAGAYGLLTGTPGAVVVTRGPGLTSAATGLAQATLDHFPLLLISDTVGVEQARRVGHQRLDQPAVTRPLTRWSATLGGTGVEQTVAAAARMALGPPAGAVHLDFDPGSPSTPPPATAAAAPLDDGALQRAVRTAAGRRRPIVLVGMDAAGAAAEVRAALAGTGVPVLASYQGAGVVPADYPGYAGLFTNASAERRLLAQADLIVVVGLDPVEPLPTPWSYPAPVLQLHPASVGSAYFGRPEAVVGPLGASLPAVLAATEPGWEPAAGRRFRAGTLRALDDDGGGFRPLDLVTAVRRCADPQATVTVDAGAHMLVAMPVWDAHRPYQILISNGLSTMGFSLPAAIGAGLAEPGRPVVCFVGDGGLGMTAAELETVARLGLDVTVVVFNDAALSLIEVKQGGGQGGSDAVRYGPVDFALLARAAGLPAAVATSAQEAVEALRTAGRGPYLLDARVDPASYRHVLAVTRG